MVRITNPIRSNGIHKALRSKAEYVGRSPPIKLWAILLAVRILLKVDVTDMSGLKGYRGDLSAKRKKAGIMGSDRLYSTRASEDGASILVRVDRQREAGWVPQGINIYLSLERTGQNRSNVRGDRYREDLGATWAKPLTQRASQAKSALNGRGKPITMHGKPYDGKLSRTVWVAEHCDYWPHIRRQLIF